MLPGGWLYVCPNVLSARLWKVIGVLWEFVVWHIVDAILHLTMVLFSYGVDHFR